MYWIRLLISVTMGKNKESLPEGFFLHDFKPCDEGHADIISVVQPWALALKCCRQNTFSMKCFINKQLSKKFHRA